MTNTVLEEVLSEICLEEDNDFTIEKLRNKVAMVKQFVERWYMFMKKRFDCPEAAEARFRLVEFGSCALTPNYRAMDVDLLLMGSPHVLNDSAESNFEEFIKARPGITCVSRCEGSRFTPALVRFKLDQFSVDLQFARVDDEALDEHYSLNRDWSQVRPSLDANSLMSLRAVAVSRKILEIVPETKRFRLILRLVKRWALRRAIYKHKFGYPGGIAFTILVAKVCKELDPMGNKPIRELFEDVFLYYAMNTWGEDQPVYLENYAPDANHSRSKDYMQVFTPESNPWNCTHNVNNSTLPVVKQEFKRAKELVDRYRGQNLSFRNFVYELCEGDNFFHKFPLYLQFNCLTLKEDDYFEDFTVIALRTFCASLDSTLKEHWGLNEEQILEVELARLYPFTRKDEKRQSLISADQEVHSYWVGAWLTGEEYFLPELVIQFTNVMKKTSDRRQFQQIFRFRREDLPPNVFPKRWRGFASWKTPQIMNSSAIDNCLMSYMHCRSPSPLPQITPSQSYTRGRAFLHVNHPLPSQKPLVLHKPDLHQQPGSVNQYLVNNGRPNSLSQNKKYLQSSQFQSQRFPNASQFQSNSSPQSGRRRQRHNRISQQNAEQPLPVVINNSHWCPNPPSVNIESRALTAPPLNLTRDDTNTFPTTSSRIGRNPNGHGHTTNRVLNYVNNPNLNKTPSPEPILKKIVYENPNRHPKMAKCDVITEVLVCEGEENWVTAHPNEVLPKTGIFKIRKTSGLPTTKTDPAEIYVYNHPTKNSSKDIKGIPAEKLIPRRMRVPAAVDSPPGTPENDSSSSEDGLSDHDEEDKMITPQGNNTFTPNQSIQKQFFYQPFVGDETWPAVAFNNWNSRRPAQRPMSNI